MKSTPSFLLSMAVSPVIFAACLLMGTSGLGLPDLADPAGRSIFDLRFFRTLAGFVTGASLAVAGTAMQAVLRNPLAEPYVLGVSGGAGLGAALAIVLGFSSPFALPASAFVCALMALAGVYALANRGGRLSIYGLILSGVIVSTLASNAIMGVVALAPVEGLHSVIWWMLGNLEMHSRPLLMAASGVIGAGIALLWAFSPELNALTLGTEMAHFVGVRTRLAVTVTLVTATLVTAAGVSVAGLIGFVGLIVPHVARALTGPDHRRLIPVAALLGGCFLAASDALARSALYMLTGNPQEIPVGVITALFGGPFFLVILRRRQRRGWIG